MIDEKEELEHMIHSMPDLHPFDIIGIGVQVIGRFRRADQPEGVGLFLPQLVYVKILDNAIQPRVQARARLPLAALGQGFLAARLYQVVSLVGIAAQAEREAAQLWQQRDQLLLEVALITAHGTAIRTASGR